MAGLRKAKKYDWKDSNLALFGSDLEKNVKKASAECEGAWQGAGSKVGIEIWRIVQFKVQPWPKEDYGKFFGGDSYIILHTYKNPDEEDLEYDVYFWIGKESTQDEYGTAAYKTVELDTLLNDKPVQHREVMGHESEEFMELFPTFTVMKGGAASGFKHVKPEEYKPRLLRIVGERRNVQVKEVSVKKESLCSDDCFILDTGKVIYQWNGSKCNMNEKFKAAQVVQQIESDRCGKVKGEVVDERDCDRSHEFYQWLQKADDDVDDDEEEESDEGNTPQELFRLSDASGKMVFNKQKDGSAVRTDFKSDDVFIYDTKKSLFVWIGQGTTANEKKNAMQYAHNYLQKTKHPFIPVSCVQEGRESKSFKSAIAA